MAEGTPSRAAHDAAEALHAGCLSPEAVAQLARLAVDPTRGLSWDEVRRRQRIHGRNLASRSPSQGAARPVEGAPAVAAVALALVFAGALLAHAHAALVAWGVVGVAVLLSVWGWRRALRGGSSSDAPWQVWVLREGGLHRVAASDLVPGDILWLSEGGLFPAQLMLLAHSRDWRTEPWRGRERVVAGSAWALVVRLGSALEEGSAEAAARRLPWLQGGMAVAAVAAWVTLLAAQETPLALLLYHAGALLFLLFPWGDRLWALGAQRLLRRRLRQAGLWFRSWGAVETVAHGKFWRVHWPAWFPEWRVASLLLPFDTLRFTWPQRPDASGDEGAFCPTLWRGERAVVNPLGVTGTVPLAQALRVAFAPAPGFRTLANPPSGPVAEALWRATEWLVADEARDPLRQWRVVARERRPEWGAFGWLTRCQDARGRLWSVATGDPEALWAAGVARGAWGGAVDRDRWRERVARAQAAGEWVIGVAQWVVGREESAAKTSAGLAAFQWLGAWGVVPVAERCAAEVPLASLGVTVAVAGTFFPDATRAAWSERGWWPGEAPEELSLLSPIAPWVRVEGCSQGGEGGALVLLAASEWNDAPVADVALEGGLAALAEWLPAVRATEEQLRRFERRLRWRWPLALFMIALWLGGDPFTPLAVVPVVALLPLAHLPLWARMRYDTITISENAVSGAGDATTVDDRRE